jgi:hypothetical protein
MDHQGKDKATLLLRSLLDNRITFTDQKKQSFKKIYWGYSSIYSDDSSQFSQSCKAEKHETVRRTAEMIIYPDTGFHIIGRKNCKRVSKMKDNGIIEGTQGNNWRFSLLTLRKKNGPLLLVIEYRKLNKLVIADPLSLPNIDEILSTLQGKSIFIKLDAAYQLWQIQL